MRIVIVIQARMASTRLPGKVMLPLLGEPLLARMIERVRLSEQSDELVVATTPEAEDDVIVDLCRRLQTAYFRGHPEDCLKRHLDAGRRFRADAVTKIPSDCPMIDPAVIDRVLGEYRRLAAGVDYVSDLHPGTWPDGNDVEVMGIDVLERAAAESRSPFDREHTTPYVWSNPARFRLHNVRWHTGQDLSRSHRWVVDWVEDYRLVVECFGALYPRFGPAFHVEDVLSLYRTRPELAAINAQHRHYDYRLTRPVADTHLTTRA